MKYWNQTCTTFSELGEMTPYDLGFLRGTGNIDAPIHEYTNWEYTDQKHDFYLKGLIEGLESINFPAYIQL